MDYLSCVCLRVNKVIFKCCLSFTINISIQAYFLLILEKYKAHVRCNWLGVKVVTIELETFSFRLSRYSLNEDITY